MTPKKLINEILSGNNQYFGYAHFVDSNMSDYGMMSDTINDITAVYGFNEVVSADIVASLTHSDNN